MVKLIDVYPDQYPQKPELGGYQLAIAMDIMRGRYRTDPGAPRGADAERAANLRIRAAGVNYVVQPGHRLMVQVQSSWFPLYDRNPQTFVPNIFFAKPGDYRPATQKVFTGDRRHVDRPSRHQVSLREASGSSRSWPYLAARRPPPGV